MKVIIVEDEQATREALAVKLTREGFNVIQAGNGQLGIDLIKKELPDLVILDLLLPIKNGETIVYEMRINDATKHIPIYMISNVSDLDTYYKGLRAQIDLYDIKSEVKIEDIITKIKRVLKRP